MLLAVAITALLLLIVLAVLVGLASREDDEIGARTGRHDDRGPY